MHGPRAPVLTTLSRVSAFPELSPLTLSPGVTHIRAEGQCFSRRHFLHSSSHVYVLAPISSLPELHQLHESIPRGAGSPEASPVSSSLSIGTMPRDDKSALVSSDSDPEHPLSPTVGSDPDDGCCVTCWDHSGLEHMPSIANPFATSCPCTLTCAGTCSHLTSLPGFAISWSSISPTGTWTCSLPDVVAHPLDL